MHADLSWTVVLWLVAGVLGGYFFSGYAVVTSLCMMLGWYWMELQTNPTIEAQKWLLFFYPYRIIFFSSGMIATAALVRALNIGGSDDHTKRYAGPISQIFFR